MAKPDHVPRLDACGPLTKLHARPTPTTTTASLRPVLVVTTQRPTARRTRGTCGCKHRIILPEPRAGAKRRPDSPRSRGGPSGATSTWRPTRGPRAARRSATKRIVAKRGARRFDKRGTGRSRCRVHLRGLPLPEGLPRPRRAMLAAGCRLCARWPSDGALCSHSRRQARCIAPSQELPEVRARSRPRPRRARGPKRLQLEDARPPADARTGWSGGQWRRRRGPRRKHGWRGRWCSVHARDRLPDARERVRAAHLSSGPVWRRPEGRRRALGDPSHRRLHVEAVRWLGARGGRRR